MTFVETRIPGAFVIEPTIIPDERGLFMVGIQRAALEARGLTAHIEQVNFSLNPAKGTLRGLHYQGAPFGEAKVVRCVRGALFDVIVDLRPASPTYCQWHGMELTESNRLALYLPAGLAHGFQTLADATEVMYTVSAPYTPSHYRGVRWDDPAFGILWPEAASRIMHERDRAFPDFRR